MRHALKSETKETVAPRTRRRDDPDDAPVLSNEAVLAHLEADFEFDPDGDPIKGIAIALVIGAAFWIVLAAALVIPWT